MASTESPATSGWLGELRDELADLDRQCLRRTVLTPRDGQGETLSIDGRELLNLTSNNYLGLAADPRVVEASAAAARAYGASVSASRLLCGSTPLHEELETRLAALKNQEAALLYSSGYLANLGVLTALARPGDAIFSDALNHASIIDGCRLSGAGTTIYRHCDAGHLAELLASTPARRRLIVSETVFSMDGDIAPLPALVELARAHDAVLVLDEAHATGVLGPNGEGALAALGLDSEGIILVGTLSKALASAGGFVAADATVIDYLVNRSRPFIFNTALPPASVGAALAALDIVAAEPERRVRLDALATRLRDGLLAAGYPPSDSETAIVPLLLGSAGAALALERRLRDAGILSRAIRPPTVPEGTARIRFNLIATHTPDDVDRVLAAVPPPA
ncbi:MAG: 8-amino-7-oxononanoate synthase [Dehalococcoidia bacterium]|nr:8-amino-7-oxononanoate synthase [Dehalococcoidia bacterium]